MPNGALIEAYRTTRFVAYDGQHEITVRIDERSPEVDALLDRYGARSGSFITAWNPRSKPQSRAMNDAAAKRLAAVVAAAGYPALPHKGISADGAWFEEGLFAIGIPVDRAIAIAAEFRQNAITVIDRGSVGRLVFTPLFA